MPSISVKDATGATQTVQTVPAVGSAASAASLPVVIASDQAAVPVTPAGNVAAGATDSGNPVKIGGVYNSTPVVLTTGQRGNLQMDSVGSARTLPACNASYVMVDTYAAQNPAGLPDNNNTPRPLGVVSFVYNGSNYNWQRGDSNGTFMVAKPVTSGGLSISRLVGATSGVVKASAGQLYTGTLTNTNAAIRYLQIYNKTTAGTLSTDTPVLTVPLPPNQTVMVDFSVLGGAFATGISWQFTTDDVAIPTTAGATTDIHGFVTYK